MSKKKSFPTIQKIAGIDGEGLIIQEKGILSTKEGVFLEESQLDAIEASAAGHEAAIEAERGKVTTAVSNLTNANTKVTTMENAINNAITKAGLDSDVAADATIDQKITLLSEKVVEYGKASGKGTKPHSAGDATDTDENDQSKTSNIMKTM